jgi:hypothetical protein
MNNYRVSDGVERLADKLARLAGGEAKLQKVIVETTLLAQEAIVEKITNDIEPHSGMGRKNNPQAVVTDLVDTGHYRASWQVSFPGPWQGKLSTTCEYALLLEYGIDEEVDVKSHTRTYKKGRKKGKTEIVAAHSRMMSRKPHYVARDTAVKMRVVLVEKMQKAIKELLQ